MTRRTTRTGEAPRASLERPISLRFKHSGDFVDELAANVSTGGMFIRTRNPHPVGSVFEFELHVGDELPLLSGKAQIAWVRRRSQSADEPSGMGARFVELDDDSRRHIAELVAAHEGKGGHPLEPAPPEPPDTAAVEAPAAGPDPTPPRTGAAAAGAASAAAAPAPAGRAMSAPAERRSRRLPWILLAVALLAALTAALWPRPVPAPRPTATTAAAEPGAPAPHGAGSPASVEPAAKPQQLQLVEDWSRAWSDQRVDAYLDAYSPRFVPSLGVDRASWERQRRSRILAPRWIDVDLALIELEELDDDRSRVRFVQAYESDSYRDVVRKTLELERTERGWKILRETVEP